VKDWSLPRGRSRPRHAAALRRWESYPPEPVLRECQVCARGGVHEQNTFVVLNGGGRAWCRGPLIGPHPRVKAFLDLGFLGITGSGPDGKPSDPSAFVPLADGTDDQFSFYFCSTGCLRTFLNCWADALEDAITKSKRLIAEDERRKSTRSPRRAARARA
jgi:hypothetical protein